MSAEDAVRPAVSVVEVVVPILRAWGLQSNHGEWSDTETREQAARNIAEALAQAGIGDVAEARAEGAQAVLDAVERALRLVDPFSSPRTRRERRALRMARAAAAEQGAS